MKKGFTAEQIIKKLREAEVLLSKGEKVEQAIRKIGVSDVTYYRWRKEYGGNEGRPGKEAQGPGERKWPVKETGCGSVSG